MDVLLFNVKFLDPAWRKNPGDRIEEVEPGLVEDAGIEVVAHLSPLVAAAWLKMDSRNSQEADSGNSGSGQL